MQPCRMALSEEHFPCFQFHGASPGAHGYRRLTSPRHCDMAAARATQPEINRKQAHPQPDFPQTLNTPSEWTIQVPKDHGARAGCTTQLLPIRISVTHTTQASSLPMHYIERHSRTPHVHGVVAVEGWTGLLLKWREVKGHFNNALRHPHRHPQDAHSHITIPCQYSGTCNCIGCVCPHTSTLSGTYVTLGTSTTFSTTVSTGMGTGLWMIRSTGYGICKGTEAFLQRLFVLQE